MSQDNPDIERARGYVAIANKSVNPDTIKYFSKMAYPIAKKHENIPILLDCVNNLAYAYAREKNYDSAIIYYRQHYVIVSDDTTKKKDMARTLSNLGICFKYTNNYMEMWNSFRQGKAIFEELHDTLKICWTTMAIGESYEHFGMYQQARDNYEHALNLAKSVGDSMHIASGYLKIAHAALYEYLDDNSDSASAKLTAAIGLINSSINTCKQIGVQADTLYSLAILTEAKCYMALSSKTGRDSYADSSRVLLDRYNALALHKPISDSLAVEVMRAKQMMRARKYRDAIPRLVGASKLPVKQYDFRQMAEVYSLLSQCYAATGNVKEAYNAKKMHHQLHSKVSNEENMRRTANFAAQTQIEVARQEQSDNVKHIAALEQAEKSRQATIFKAVAVGLVVAVIIVLLIVRSLHRKHRLNKELSDRNDQLLAQRDIIEQQKNDEQKAQAIILADVEYASKIQSQAIGSVESVAAVFPESFVYYRPRDIVSGDWYMASVLRGYRIMIEADCTGHGIPGALLCMLGVSALKDIFNTLRYGNSEILPGLILDEMRVSIKKSLNKYDDDKFNIDDGMDMTIVMLPPSGGQLLFGGACQSAVLVRGGTPQRLKGDANPIGNYVREKEHFSTIKVDVAPGDAVYLFSDGIQDQIGGEEGRKYSFKRLMDFLAAHYALPMQEQKALFEEEFDSYVGSSAQMDDRTLVGIRI